MIDPVQLSLSQNIAFLVKSDLRAHDVMQSLMRQVAREFAMADMVAASRPLTPPNIQENNAVRSSIDGTLASIESIVLPHQLNYPLVLKRALEMFGLDESTFYAELHESAEEIARRQEEGSGSGQGSSDDSANDDDAQTDPIAVDLMDVSVFRAVDQLLPELQDLGQCAGMQLSFFRTPSHINGIWKHRDIVIMIPIDGELGRQHAAFTYLLRRDFDPIALQGKMSLYPGNPIQPWPCQQLFVENHNDLVMQARLQLEGNDIVGKSFLMGMITEMLPLEHWLEYDHRDIS